MSAQTKISFYLKHSLNERQQITIKDLRDFVNTMSALSDDHLVDICNILVQIEVDQSKVENIICGDCVPQKPDHLAQDLLITVHDCTRQ